MILVLLLLLLAVFALGEVATIKGTLGNVLKELAS